MLQTPFNVDTSASMRVKGDVSVSNPTSGCRVAFVHDLESTAATECPKSLPRSRVRTIRKWWPGCMSYPAGSDWFKLLRISVGILWNTEMLCNTAEKSTTSFDPTVYVVNIRPLSFFLSKWNPDRNLCSLTKVWRSKLRVHGSTRGRHTCFSPVLHSPTLSRKQLVWTSICWRKLPRQCFV